MMSAAILHESCFRQNLKPVDGGIAATNLSHRLMMGLPFFNLLAPGRSLFPELPYLIRRQQRAYLVFNLLSHHEHVRKQGTQLLIGSSHLRFVEWLSIQVGLDLLLGLLKVDA